MNMKKRILPALLLVSSVLVGALGGYLKYALLEPLGIIREESVFAMPFVMMKDEGLRFMVERKRQLPAPEQTPDEPTAEPLKPAETKNPSQTEPIPTEETTPETQPQRPEYVQLDESWFDDALFVGDSRTAGMRNYYRLGQADYFTNIGMNIYNVFIQMSSDTNMDATLLEDLLQKKTYGKILIGIGLNECNYPHEEIESGFARLVEMIRTHQPDAIIILESIMTVTEKYSKSADHFSLENLNAINEIIGSFADGEHVFYLDLNEWAAGEDGYLPTEKTFDGVHLYGVGYEELANWFVDACGRFGIA